MSDRDPGRRLTHADLLEQFGPARVIRYPPDVGVAAGLPRATDPEAVYAVHLASDEVTPVNRDLITLVEFLFRAAVADERTQEVEAGDLSQADYLAQAERLQSELKSIDPEALTDGHFWPGIVEEFTMM